MQKNYVVNISEEITHFVEPFTIHLHPGDSILFKTDEKTSAAVVIPGVKLFTDYRGKDNYKEFVLERNAGERINISLDATKGYYTDHVLLLEDIKQFADKPDHSAPKIIIE
jgi:hypothetical protein